MDRFIIVCVVVGYMSIWPSVIKAYLYWSSDILRKKKQKNTRQGQGHKRQFLATALQRLFSRTLQKSVVKTSWANMNNKLPAYFQPSSCCGVAFFSQGS